MTARGGGGSGGHGLSAIGFRHAEDLLADLGGTRLWSARGEGALISEWALPSGRVTLSQGPDNRLRFYTIAAEADRIKPDSLLDAIVHFVQSLPPNLTP